MGTGAHYGRLSVLLAEDARWDTRCVDYFKILVALSPLTQALADSDLLLLKCLVSVDANLVCAQVVSLLAHLMLQLRFEEVGAPSIHSIGDDSDFIFVSVLSTSSCLLI